MRGPTRETLPRLHVVTADAVLLRPDFATRAAALLETGGARVALHLRARTVPAVRLLALAETLVASAERSGSLVILNDRVDVALAAGAHGAQVGARGLPLEAARRLLGSGRWLGASVHSDAEADAAVAAGADYLLAGSVWPTATHPGEPGRGPGWLRGLATDGIPVIGIGGVTAARAGELRAAGAHGGAVIRAVWDSADPAGALRDLLTALHERPGGR